MIGSAVTGRVADAEFRRHGGTKGAAQAPAFPLERARLRLTPVYVSGSALSAVAYGWSVGRAPLAVPLIFHFVCARSVPMPRHALPLTRRRQSVGPRSRS